MLRHLVQSRSHAVRGICARGAARVMSTAQGAPQEATASSSGAAKKFLLALIPIGVIAAVMDRAGKTEDTAGNKQPAPAAAAAGTSSGSTSSTSSSAAAHGEQHPQPKVTIHGGVTSHGVEIDPSNPLHKVLPETECEFCLETREKLWSFYKNALKHGKGKGGAAASAGTAAPAPAAASGTAAEAAASASPSS